MSSPASQRLDLRGTPCPLNYIRTRLALEQLPAGVALEVWLDRGEPERLVSEGLRHEGHAVTLAAMEGEADAVRLTVHPQGGGADG
jgi:TusA-related sulfurtransferase